MTVDVQAMKEDFINCLTQQLSEFELLKSMYPNHGEIILTDKKILDDIQDFIDQKSVYIPDNLDFVLNLFIRNLKLEVSINLPSSYPNEEPDIYIRCNQLDRHQESSLNKELHNYVSNNYFREVCLYTAISWLQENIDSFNTRKDEAKPSNESNGSKNMEWKFIRLWIYSHHIYDKKKREVICKKARDLNLGGFCLPGKPGIICVEGNDTACKEWWKRIKTMNWQKIIIKETETFEPTQEAKEKKFSHFEEINFKSPDNNKSNNMTTFAKYMSDRGFSKIFNDLFGINSQ